MKIRINNIQIKNFRGIESAQLSFSDVNFLVGNNGTGKTSCRAVIARLLPILRNEERIFLNGDFLFVSDEEAKQIELTYIFDLITEDSIKNGELYATGEGVGNRIDSYHPVFVFWMQRGKRYMILFVDPRGISFATYQHKVDGYKKIFENREFSYNGYKVATKLLLHTGDIAQVGEGYRKYWFDNFEDFAEKMRISVFKD